VDPVLQKMSGNTTAGFPECQPDNVSKKGNIPVVSPVNGYTHCKDLFVVSLTNLLHRHTIQEEKRTWFYGI